MHFFEIPTFSIPLSKKRTIKSVTGFSTTTESIKTFKCFFETYQGNSKTGSESYNSKNLPIRKAFFDHQGKISEEFFYNDDASLNYKIKYEYNSNHILTREFMYLNDGSLWLTYLINHNAFGHISQVIIENNKGIVVKTSNYLYDRHGLLIKIDMGPMGTFEYSYNDDHQVVNVNIYTPSAARGGDCYQFLYGTDSLLDKIIHNSDDITQFEYGYEQ